MKAAELIEKLSVILRPEEDEDEWVERHEIGFGSFPLAIREKITAELGEWHYELCADRPFGEEDVQRSVLFFVNHNVYLAYDGWYDSWSGGNWDCAEFYEVKPVEKTYTDWEAVK